jgi:putative tryptophan/tyrosine transport system substrate-binding protein
VKLGLITYAHPEPFHTAQMDVLESGLRRLGYNDELVVRRCFGRRDLARLEGEAEALAAWKPDLIVSFMTNADLAVIRSTEQTQVPIVCWSMDPLDCGLVASMSRPGGRLTGVAFPPGLQVMQLRGLLELKPASRRVGMLFNGGYRPAQGALDKLRAAGGRFGVEVVAYEALSKDAIGEAIAAMTGDGCDGLVVGPHELFNGNGEMIGNLALSAGLPAVAMDSVVEAGGVLSFMPDFPRIWQAAAIIADKVLNGADPGGIPIDRHIKPFTTINLTAARRLELALEPAFVDEHDRRIGE